MKKRKLIFNVDYENLSIDEILSKIIEFCQTLPTFPTIESERGLKLTVIEVSEKYVLMKRSKAGETKVLFEELKKAIEILRKGNSINTTVLKGHGLRGLNQTPIIALLIASDICY